MGRGRLPVFLLLVAAVAAAAQEPTPDYIPEERAECYDCHRADPVPLRSLYVVAAPLAESRDGKLTYTVEIGNAWLHDVRYLGPRLDLSGAPSLAFADDREPVSDEATGAIDATPRAPAPPENPNILPDTGPTFAPYGGHVVLEVPAGATRVVLRMEETGGTTDPEVTWNLYSGRSAPEGEPDRTTQSRGAPAELVLEGPDGLAGIAYGNWTVEAQVLLGDESPAVGEVPFRVEVEAEFDNAANRVSRLGRQLDLGPGQASLFSWDLRVLQPPGAGESVRLDVDGSVYYDHGGDARGPADDWAHVTKGTDLPVAALAGDEVVVGNETEPVNTVTPRVPDAGLVPILEAVGYVGAFLVLASMVSGGVFGKASRRHLNKVFGTARRRVAFHNVLSYGLTLVALTHSTLFLLNNLGGGRFHWSLGILWGGGALLSMLGLGLTGALQVPIIRRWSHAGWRRTHLGLAVATLAFVALHLLLDGAHFDAVQQWLGYRNPLDTRSS